MNDPPVSGASQKGKTDMLEMLLALLLGAAPGVPFSVVPVDSLIAVVGHVGGRWDPDGRTGSPEDPPLDGGSSPTAEADAGNHWDPNG